VVFLREVRNSELESTTSTRSIYAAHKRCKMLICLNCSNCLLYVVAKSVLHAGSEALTAVVMKSSIFCDIMLCNPLKANRYFGGTHRRHLQGRRSRARNQLCTLLFPACFHAGFLFGYSSTLKMGVICSSETSVDFQRTTRRYILYDRTLRFTYCLNLASSWRCSLIRVLASLDCKHVSKAWNAYK
jgi:hypothetical protein